MAGNSRLPSRIFIVNTGAAVLTLAMMTYAYLDPRPHRSGAQDWLVAAGIILWSLAPYGGLSVLGRQVRERGNAERVVLAGSSCIALLGLCLVSPFTYQAPQSGLLDFSWNGTWPFIVVPLFQWPFIVVLAIVTAIVWHKSKPLDDSTNKA
jgi:hypothetical protein